MRASKAPNGKKEHGTKLAVAASELTGSCQNCSQSAPRKHLRTQKPKEASNFAIIASQRKYLLPPPHTPHLPPMAGKGNERT